MKIRQLICKKDKWCQEKVAIDENGNEIIPDGNNKPVSYCLTGALIECYNDKKERGDIEMRILNFLRAKYGEAMIQEDDFDKCPIERFNDGKKRKYKEIRELVRTLDI